MSTTYDEVAKLVEEFLTEEKLNDLICVPHNIFRKPSKKTTFIDLYKEAVNTYGVEELLRMVAKRLLEDIYTDIEVRILLNEFYVYARSDNLSYENICELLNIYSTSTVGKRLKYFNDMLKDILSIDSKPVQSI